MSDESSKHSTSKIVDSSFEKLLIFCPIAVTLAINPWYLLDPINLPKSLVLSSFSFMLLPYVLMNRIVVRELKSGVLLLIGIWLLTTIVSLYFSEVGLKESFWGTWGRSTGALTYINYMILLIAYGIFSYKNGVNELLRSLVISGYVIAIYTLIQFGDLDPVPWSQKLPVATLGNINFMSAFLGLLSIVLFSYLLEKGKPFAEKTFFACFLLLNLLLMVWSESIQGIAILAAGATVKLFLLIWTRARLKSFIFLLFSVGAGTILAIGSAGIGPLGQSFKQQTVLFRLDYWGAGLNMVLAKPWLGFGPDSYGQYYREFRSELATTRTGPQRVTNTAHNVLIDLMSGSGVIVGICLAGLILICLVRFLRVKRTLNSQEQVIVSLLAGWVVFLSISIGQIGVNVWGFLFLGAALGLSARGDYQSNFTEQSLRIGKTLKSKIDNKKKTQKFGETNTTRPTSKGRGLVLMLATLPFFTLGAGLATPPLISDYKFLRAIKGTDYAELKDVANSFGSRQYLLESAIERIANSGDSDTALTMAIETVETQKRSWRAWVEIALNPRTEDALRRKAFGKLVELDPFNKDVRENADALLSESRTPINK